MKVIKIVIIIFINIILSSIILIRAENITTPSFSYTFMNYEGTSNLSKDEAWYNASKQAYDDQLITEAEWKYSYIEYMQQFSDTQVSDDDGLNVYNIESSDDTYIRGQINYFYLSKKEDGSEVLEKTSLKHAKVELHRNEFAINSTSLLSTCLATTYTDIEGNYRFDLNPNDFDKENINVFIKIFPASETFKVSLDWLFLDVFYVTPPTTSMSMGTQKVINTNINYDNYLNIYNMMHIQQRMSIGEKFAQEMDFNPSKILNVQYPFNDEMPFSYCGYCGVGESYFDKVDYLIHEYGHFVEQEMGNYESGILDFIKNNPNHLISNDNFDVKPEKEYAMELTWTESWANVFSLMAQKYYKNQYKDIGFSEFGNESINGYDLENYSSYKTDVKQNSCEAQELAVSVVLWDLFDEIGVPGSIENHDDISLDYTEWWRITTKPGTFTFQDFVEKLSEETIETQLKINKLLEYHQIAPSNVSAVLDSNKLIISWTPNGSINNPNNLFNIKILSLDYTDILTINNIPLTESIGYNGKMSYALTDDEMEVLNTAYDEGLNIQIVVEGIRVGASHKDASKTMQSGPYSSYPVEFREFIQLTAPTNTGLSYDIPCFEWDHLCDCSSIEIVEYILKFYDEDGYEFLVIDDITTKSYTPTDLEWGRVIERCNQKLKFKILCIHDNCTESMNSSGYYCFDKPIVSELTLTNTISNQLLEGECNWYKFIAPHTGLFNFYSYGTTDTCCSIFDSIVGGQSETGILTNGFNDNCDRVGNCQCIQDNNFCITLNLEENQVIYLRVHGHNWNSTGSYTIVAYSDHECSYNDRYVPSILKHESYCECGDYILENHVIRFGTNRCLLCFAVVNNPNLELMSNQVIYITENGSYILSNGIIVLIDEDIKAYFDGTLVFHKKDEEIE